MTVKLKEIFFGGFGRVTVYGEGSPCETVSPSSCWGTMGGIFVGSQWKHKMNPDRAAAYVRGASMVLDVKIATHGSPAGTATLRVTGPDGLIGEVSVPVNGCTPFSRTVTITTNSLPNVVKAYTRMGLTWWIKDPGATTFRRLRNTAHFVYVTLGRPRGSPLYWENLPTKRRLNFLCYAAAQAGTYREAIDGVALGGPGIHAALESDPPCDGQELDGIPPCTGSGGIIAADWLLKAGPPFVGECHHQAHLMNVAIQMIGVSAGTEYRLRASTDANVKALECKTAAQLHITQDLDGDGESGDETLCLYFDFDPPSGAINFFEGTLEMPWGHYAVWPSLKAATGCRLLRALGDPVQMEVPATQHWMYIPGVTGPAGAGSVYIHPQEVPFPTCP